MRALNLIRAVEGSAYFSRCPKGFTDSCAAVFFVFSDDTLRVCKGVLGAGERNPVLSLILGVPVE